MRWRRLWILATAALLSYLVVRILNAPSATAKKTPPKAPVEKPIWIAAPPPPISNPLPVPPSSSHPINQLSTDAFNDFQTLRATQSKTLDEAVAEYQRRYGIHPPPLFDKWYHFAKRKNVQLIDEYDTLMNTLLPFWSLEPRTIRARVREAIGYGQNGMIALMIRGGKTAKLEGGPDWQRTVTQDMIEEFVDLLPDMDIAFNVHDEPRVVVPHDELSSMVNMAKTVAMPKALRNASPSNTFSPAPDDFQDARRRIAQVAFSRFNEFPHQHTWVPSRMSCSPDSPARLFREDVEDETRDWALGELGFVYNYTAFTDICNSPSLRATYGFFNRPNAYKVAHELVPVFSQSKLSSYQDILYPSPWYHYGKTVTDKPAETHQVQYNQSMDMDWNAKNTSFWWRGSTTGGFSREGTWRRQHRQIFMRNINADEEAQVLENHGIEGSPDWQVRDIGRGVFQKLMDIHFSGVGQCDPDDCDAQRAFFDMAPPVDPQTAWGNKFLLDIDGNAFSGRFYSFIRSKSLPIKLSIFQEWHMDWLKPWVHFVPISLRGLEHLEVIKYFAQEDEGKKIAPRLAMQGREWADQVLRNSDMEVWFFRLLLEYARILDDDRETIGFAV